MEEQGGRPYIVLAVGVGAVSTAALLIRLADAPFLAIAAYRMALASTVVVPIALVSHRREAASRALPSYLPPAIAGVFLALHFALWIASLELTSVASSVLLVTAHPILVALVSPLFAGDLFSRRSLAGAFIGMVGILIISGGDYSLSRQALLGDGLALGGAVMMGAYLLVGRRARGSLPFSLYLAITYSGAALLLAAAAFMLSVPLTGYEAETYVLLLLLALVPQVVGHSSLNWALRRLPAPSVAIAIMGEPVGAALLALAVLGEVPPWTSVAGGAVVLLGIYLALKRSNYQRRIPVVDA